ncbi:hypothetical protein [Methyloversatilis discipulorum]|uniref:hypothetical protein n=1 Tax=Methyloversatilis discipulorum TaxID=1119528 RepID=UPI001A419C20|nr:hypothetical protein [Methyloversatilis discipulorum]MBL8466286.1 hypothetical protein [Methyloversatilis discipulorum]
MKSSLMTACCVAVLLAGCSGLASTQARDNSTETHKNYWAKYEHSRSSMPASSESKPLFGGSSASEEQTVAASRAARMGPGCTEPGTDSTLKLIAQLEASGKAAGNGQVDANVVRLAERAQMLSFLRESLYRTCERLAAGQITKEEAAAANDKVMNSVHAIIETDRDLARKSAADALKGLTPEQIKALQ